MSHMKWIFNMIETGTYDDFKKEYIECVLKNKEHIDWEGMEIPKLYARNVVKYIDNHLGPKYDKHKAEHISNYEYEANY